MEEAQVQPVAQPITSAVSIKLTPYWPNDPALWFTQVEAQFTTRGITADATKFAYVVGSLQPEVAQEVRDILLNPPTDDLYKTLKTAIVKRTSDSDQKRLHQLLTAEELGDRKPTQLYRRMQQLLGDSQLQPSIMKQLFLHRLPTNAQLILASTKDDLDTAALARLADKILAISPNQAPAPTLTAVSQPSAPSTELQELRELVNSLATTVSNLQLDGSRHRGRPQSNSRSQHGSSRDRSYSPDNHMAFPPLLPPIEEHNSRVRSLLHSLNSLAQTASVQPPIIPLPMVSLSVSTASLSRPSKHKPTQPIGATDSPSSSLASEPLSKPI